ncbi:hypothetical protein EVAR_57630_1 [Eumeta japonica]|uniref:Uncharacterized protein n=1 Tax=Eumeta variegata TaxID=151549 RepID=A0A4C1ZL61_EUMVA|nr:hypothetical protein EVAR_57630_1 [Eumeta japonica]
MVPQVDHVIQISRAAYAKLHPIIASRLPIRTKIAIYKSYMHSRLTYAAPDTGPYTSLQNLALQHRQPPKGYQLPRDLLSTPPNEDKV